MKTKSIFELQVVNHEKHRSLRDNSYGYDIKTVGYFQNIKTAEGVMEDIVMENDSLLQAHDITEWDIPFAFFVKERPVFDRKDTEERKTVHRNPYDSIRSYDCKGNLICVHDYDDGDIDTCKKRFDGRDPETIRFKHGDFVHVLGDRIRTAIVFSPPITKKEWKERHGKETSDASDDSYLVIHVDNPGDFEKFSVCPDENDPQKRSYVDTHDHIMAFNVFPASLPVPLSHLVRLEEKMKEHIEIGGYRT